MNAWPMIVVVCVGAVAGASVAIIQLIKNKNGSTENGTKKLDISQDLLDTQLVCDVLSLSELKKWFKEEALKCDDKPIGIIMKPKETFLEGLGFSGDNKIDPEHYIFQVIYENGSNEIREIFPDKIKSIRMINFNTIPMDFKKQLDEQDGMLFVTI